MRILITRKNNQLYLLQYLAGQPDHLIEQVVGLFKDDDNNDKLPSPWSDQESTPTKRKEWRREDDDVNKEYDNKDGENGGSNRPPLSYQTESPN